MGGGDAEWDMVLDVHGMRLHKHGIALNVVANAESKESMGLLERWCLMSVEW